MSKSYRKHYIPLESDPDIFTALIHNLGVDRSLSFHDVLSIDDPDLIALLPRPVLALILIFPTSAVYDTEFAREEANRAEHNGKGDDEEVFWLKQTIHNACGLYGILHAVCNEPARHFISPGSSLDLLLQSCVPLNPQDRALALENSRELELAHKEAAVQGQTEVPASAEDEVDFHYICFVRSRRNGHLYELDGDKKGPVDRGAIPSEEDMMGPTVLQAIRNFISREDGKNPNFGLMALVQEDGS